MYIVLSTTIGAASWPLLTAREKENCGCSCLTFDGFSSVSEEKRVEA